MESHVANRAQNGEMSFLFGGNILKAHVGRSTDNTLEGQGVVVFNMRDVPLVSLQS
jgi:ribosome biogenesis protein Nip4